jgi:5-formyltetrahydrofolate cyclo-ligase
MIEAAEKTAQRGAGKAARRALSPAQRAGANAALCAALLADIALCHAGTVLAYRSFGAEADCAAFCREAEARGIRIAYPRCSVPGQMEAFVPSAEGWTRDFYGILSPEPGHSLLLSPEEIDAVLVPLTAFDAACRRVGMGAGIYDRYLPCCPQALKYGTAFSVQQVRRADTTREDALLDAVFTESAVFRRFTCGPAQQVL